jgi:ATP-dependent RNA helicase DeaD
VAVVLVPHARRRRAEGLFRLAGLDLPLEPPPTADEIRARDQDRLAQSLRPTGDPQEEDLAVARTLLADLSAEVVVASLVRAARAKLPAAEDLMSEPEPARPSRTPRQGFEDTVWFSLDIGRHRNADPKWLLPLICRRGGITKREIGAIRTFERETRFEVVSAAADAFFEASRQDEADGGPIRRLQDPDAPAPQRAARAERTRSGPTSASGPRAPGQAAKKPYPKGKAAPWARKRKP